MPVIKSEDRFTGLTAQREDKVTIAPVRPVEEYDAEAANDLHRPRLLDRIRKYEYPIDYDAQ